MNTLYSFRRCPFAMRARFALVTAGMPFELREVDLKNKPPQMLEISPKGTVPVLILEDGTIIDESRDVMQFALGEETSEQTELLNFADQKLIQAISKYKYPDRYPDDEAVKNGPRGTDQTWRGTVIDMLAEYWESKLQKGQYLFGEDISAADIGTFVFVRQFAQVEPDAWQQDNLPHTKQWLEGFLTHPTFIKIMAKHKPWAEGDAPIIIS